MTTDKLIFGFLISVYFITAATAIEKASDARIKEVAQLGTTVMPFDLDQTLHIFNKTEAGGIQQVIAKDAADKSQIKLIRSHLRKIANDFKQADFSDPEKIHGEDMPGLNALRSAAPGAITLQYRDLPDGAEISYSSEKPELINGIHQWFDAQLRDHGRHATMHRLHHGMPDKE